MSQRQIVLQIFHNYGFQKKINRIEQFYELDKFPPKCANNYIYFVSTNIFSADVKGTNAAFITVKDIISFLTNLLKESLIKSFYFRYVLFVKK